MIAISFPDKSPAEASVLVQNLHRLLRLQGVPEEALSIAPQSSEAMSLGSDLVVNLEPILRHAEFFVGLGVLSLHVSEFLHRFRAAAKIKTTKGEITVGASQTDVQAGAELIEKALRDERPG